MKAYTRVAVALLAGLALTTSLPGDPASSNQYESTLQNSRVQVFRVRLAQGPPGPVYLANHDQVWIAISDLELVLRSTAQSEQRVRMSRGDVRFVAHASAKTMALVSAAPSELIVVIINARGHQSVTCDCTGGVAETVCGCATRRELPRLWAVALGNLTLAGTTLQPGQSYPEPANRADMLLVATTHVMLRDAADVKGSDATGATRSAEINVNPGDSAWIPAGRHRFENTGTAPAQFITLEF